MKQKLGSIFRKVMRKIFCFFGIHFHFRGSRFADWHCMECGKFLEEAITYNNGHVDPHYTGRLYDHPHEDKLYRLIDGKKVYE